MEVQNYVLICFILLVGSCCGLAEFDTQWKRKLSEEYMNSTNNSCFLGGLKLGSTNMDPRRESPCGSSVSKGRRARQEDSIICVSLPSSRGDITLLGVFDGHGGNEASKIAAECFEKYFSFHLANTWETSLVEQVVTADTESYLWRNAVKEALLRAVSDVEDALLQNVPKSRSDVGTTACLAVVADGQVMLANLGDSKAFFCSSKEEAQPLYAECLTSDHHPDRPDEKSRIEASGGYVESAGGVARVNGVLAVSRSIGDFSFKHHGVTSVPEVTQWMNITDVNKYLIVASDGVFESLGTEDVCLIVEAIKTGRKVPEALKEQFSRIKVSIPLPPPVKSVLENRRIYGLTDPVEGTCDWEDGWYSCAQGGLDERTESRMAEAIIETALQLGSGDNVAAVVYALKVDYPLLQEQSETIPVTVAPPAILVEAPLCYSLVEPLDREFIFSSRHTTGEGGLARASKSVERLYLSGAFLPSVDVLPSEHPGSVSTKALGLNIQHEFYKRRDKLCQYLNLIASVPFDGESMQSAHFSASTTVASPFASEHYRYILKTKFARGSFGQVWTGVRRKCQQGENNHANLHQEAGAAESVEDDEIFVLKQILLDRDLNISLSGLREKYFGEIFLNASRSQLFFDEGLNHIARYVDSILVNDQDLWLVFKKEGQSLSKLLYVSEGTPGGNASLGENESGSFQVLKPSNWWRWLRSTQEGQQEMHNLLRQLLLAVKACHIRNIAHRDIKPENMVVQAPTEAESSAMHLNLRLIDFGSAVDPFTLKNLYGSTGPSRNEQTTEYAPPEALLLTHWLHFHPEQLKAYDMWSVGVVMLEMILGTPHVFQISSRTRLLLDRSLAGWDEDSRSVAYLLRAFMEMCVLFPRVHPRYPHRHESTNRQQEESQLASKDCSEAALLQKIRQRDPLGVGIPDVWALRLLRQLLQWYPEDRITVDEALEHPYFHPELQGRRA